MMPHEAVCPRCQYKGATTPGFTWWGGVLGPKLIKHVKCDRCAHAYNPDTGQPITGAIAIYMVIVSVIAIALVVALTRMH